MGPSSYTTPVATTGMTFDDEFNTFTSSQDGSSGTWMTNYPLGGEAAVSLAQATGEQEYYSSAKSANTPFSLSNGVLSITATQAAAGQNAYGLPYNSGQINTFSSFSQQYGYFEVTAKLPDGAGLWPAFWLLPSNNTDASELDVFEKLGENPTTIYSTTHGWSGATNQGVGQAFSVPDTAAAFHTYGVDWEPSTVTFYMDGVKLGSAPTPASMNSPMYMLLNLGVGGSSSWGGAPNASTVFPATMQIDSVRAYATAATIDVSGSAALPSAGSSKDTLVLSVNEDAYRGDAQFTISVDGVQQGGIQTATASRAAGQVQTLRIKGDFGPGSHAVTVDFLNDLYGGSASTDRNLYVTQATVDGSPIMNSSLALMAGGSQSLSFDGPGTTPSYQPTTIIGSGSDVLALQLSEDAYQGDAQFTISVDGQQIGGTQTVTAANGTGSTQAFDVLGNFAPGQHTASVKFLNDAYGGSPSLDRNLYVTQASINNTPIASSSLVEDAGGPQSFTFRTGTDMLQLGVSEDAYQGDAQYRVLVDGVDTGSTYTATASHSVGQINQQTITGGWGAGPHTVGVQFVNDAYGGSPSLDRNLYVSSASYDGSPIAMDPVQQAANSTANIAVPAVSNLTLHLAEDAYQGDAQFAVSVDGQHVGSPMTVTASDAAGASQAFNFTAALAGGSHDIGVTFLNDAYGGSPALDRNLYVIGADLNGVAQNPSSWGSAIDANGSQHFSLVVPS